MRLCKAEAADPPSNPSAASFCPSFINGSDHLRIGFVHGLIDDFEAIHKLL